MKNLFLFFFLFILRSHSFSQEIEYNVYFEKDSVKIGDSIILVSILQYPSNIELVQPDSSFSYNSFEFISKSAYSSIKKSNLLYDSTLYFLRTFSLDSIQKISLRAIILNTPDSLQITSNLDSIYLISQVKDLSSSTIDNTIYNRIKNIFNSQKYILILISITVFLLVLYLVFRKRIKKYFLIKNLKTQFLKFNKQFEILNINYQKNNGKIELEKLILFWKRYFEKLTTYPFSSSTTTEISQFYKDKDIIKLLNEIDKFLYSNVSELIEIKKISVLKDKASLITEEKINLIKSGK